MKSNKNKMDVSTAISIERVSKMGFNKSIVINYNDIWCTLKEFKETCRELTGNNVQFFTPVGVNALIVYKMPE